MSLPPFFASYQLNPTVINAIWLERLRQQDLFRAGKFSFNCATMGILPDRKLRVVMEELGEVAQAIDALECAVQKPSESEDAFVRRLKKLRAELRAEITQVAACCVAWLESLEEEKQ